MDSRIGTAGNDSFLATNSTLTLGDTINGGAGTDTLTLNTTAAFTGLPTGATVSNVENFVINGSEAITADITENAGFTALTTSTSGAKATTLTGTAAQNLTASVTGATTTTSTITTTGGKDVSITYSSLLATAATGSILASSGATGSVTVKATQTSAAVEDTNVTTGGAINVTGGTSVNVTQNISATAAAAATINKGNVTVTHTGGKVTVTGGTATKDVTVTQTAAVTAVADATIGREGIVAGAVDVLDANRASTTAAGTTETVTLTNAAAAVVNSGALKTLNLNGSLVTVNAGTLGALTTAANSALALNLTGAKSAGAVTIDNDIKTLNISGNTTASTLNSLVAEGATKINVTGDAKVTLTGNTTGAVTDIVVTNSKGAVFGTAIGAGVNFTGGAGDDAIILTTGFTKAITMGDGNDTVTVGAATAGTGGSVSGGAGIDTLVMATADADALDASSVFNSKFTGFEVLRITNAHTTTIDLDGLNAVTTVRLAAGSNAGTINNLSSGGTIRIDADNTTGLTVGVKSALVGAADVLNLDLRKSGGVLALGTITAANVETVNIVANDAVTADSANLPLLGSTANINTLTLAATSAKTITVSGNNGLTLVNTNNIALTTFDASGVVANNTAASTYLAATSDSAANLAVTFASATTEAGTAVGQTVTIKGGAGNDTLTGNALKDNISGGAGIDTIYADNTGTKEAQSLTPAAANATAATKYTVNVLGITFETTEVAATATVLVIGAALKAAIEANVSSKLVTVSAVDGTTGAITLTYLVDGDLPQATAVKTAGTATSVITAATGTAGVAGTAAADVIDGGAGADVIVGGGGADVITTGADADTVFFLKAHSNLATIATITDYTFAVGGSSNDKIIIGDVTTAAGTVKTVQDLSSSASLTAAINAAALNNVVDAGLSVFIFGGDTFAYVETTGATATYDATDFVVKLTGLPLAAGAAYGGAGFDAVAA